MTAAKPSVASRLGRGIASPFVPRGAPCPSQRSKECSNAVWIGGAKPKRATSLDALGRPAAQQRIQQLMDRGFHKPGDVENRLGYYVGQLGG
jgi:hypothetical protein